MLVPIDGKDLKVGDVIADGWDGKGRKQITAIRPYRGPLDFVLTILDFSVGLGMSVCEGDQFQVVRLDPPAIPLPAK